MAAIVPTLGYDARHPDTGHRQPEHDPRVGEGPVRDSDEFMGLEKAIVTQPKKQRL